MKVYIETDERYPDYIVTTENTYGDEVDADEETLRRWGEAERAYEQRHTEIAAVLRAHRQD